MVKQFWIYWRPGKLNYADYWKKHHAAAHHQNVQKEFLTPHIVLKMTRLEQVQAVAAAQLRLESMLKGRALARV